VARAHHRSAKNIGGTCHTRCHDANDLDWSHRHAYVLHRVSSENPCIVLDLFRDHLEPFPFAFNLDLQPRRKRPTIAGPHLIKTLTLHRSFFVPAKATSLRAGREAKRNSASDAAALAEPIPFGYFLPAEWTRTLA
jgi:hypothetical protein